MAPEENNNATKFVKTASTVVADRFVVLWNIGLNVNLFWIRAFWRCTLTRPMSTAWLMSVRWWLRRWIAKTSKRRGFQVRWCTVESLRSCACCVGTSRVCVFRTLVSHLVVSLDGPLSPDEASFENAPRSFQTYATHLKATGLQRRSSSNRKSVGTTETIGLLFWKYVFQRAAHDALVKSASTSSTSKAVDAIDPTLLTLLTESMQPSKSNEQSAKFNVVSFLECCLRIEMQTSQSQFFVPFASKREAKRWLREISLLQQTLLFGKQNSM